MSVIDGLVAWGYSVENILVDWESMGIFEYVLPFLLLFAVVFGILVKSKVLGDNKGVNAVISLAIGLLAIQSFTLRSFFHTISAYAGMGIMILLVLLILTGLFQSDQPWWGKTFFGIGMFVAIVVILYSLSSYEWSGGWWWRDKWPAIITFGIIIALLVFIVFFTKERE